MKVKHVLMIAAVLLAMFVAPVVADELVIGAEDTAEYSFQIPDTLDFPSIDADAQVTTNVDVIITRINPNHIVTVSVNAGDDDWYLKHVINDGYRLQYQMTVDGSVMDNDDVVISTVVNASKEVVFTLMESATKSGRYEDTLTFIAEMEMSDSNELVVSDTNDAQAALDNAVAGTVIQLKPGVNYGTLEVRANVIFDEGTKIPAVGSENTESVDFSDKYPTGEYLRKFEDITIIGAEGATVDAIKFVTGTFKLDKPDGKQTGSMYRYVEVKNLVIDGVEFTDDTQVTPDRNWYSPICFDLTGVSVDGLTVQNCKLVGNNDKINFVYAYGAIRNGFTFKNINLVDNTVSGIARLCELREAENVVIKDNNVADLSRELALLANNQDMAYSGNIIVIRNTADNIAGDYKAEGEPCLFFRVGVGGDANIVVTNNEITNSGTVDVNSFVRVTGHTGTLTVENNILS